MKLKTPYLSINKVKQKCCDFFRMMPALSTDKNFIHYKIPLILTALYLLVRACILFVGINMEATIGGMFMMDINLMQNDFWVNLWSMHAQPPLFAIFTWLVINLSPFEQYWIAALPIFVVLGVILMLTLYNIQLRLGVPAYWSAGIAFLFSISANSLYYGSYFLYTFPITVLITLSIFNLIKFVDKPSYKNASYIFFCLVAVSLLHSIFHLVFFVVAALLLFLFIGKYRWKILLGCIIPLCIILSWYGKTYMQTGQFAASTWGGLSISNIMLYYPTSPEEKNNFIKEGVITPNAHIKPFTPVEAYPNFEDVKESTGIPILDMVKHADGKTSNLHHLAMATFSKEAEKNSLNMLKTHPEVYLKGTQAALYLFMLSPSEWFHTYGKNATEPWDRAWSFITTGRMNWTSMSQSQILRERWTKNHDMPNYIWEYIEYNGWTNFPWFTPFILLGLIGYGFCVACHKSYNKDPQAIVYWAMLYIIGYVTTTSILLEIGENQRYRYYMSPMLAILFSILSLKIYRIFFTGYKNLETSKVRVSNDTKSDKKNFFIKLFNGDIPLKVTFWVFAGFGLVAFPLLFNYINTNYDSFIYSLKGMGVVAIFYWFVLFYCAFVYISIWRSAGKYKDKFPYAGQLARALVLIGLLGLINGFCQRENTVTIPQKGTELYKYWGIKK
tara:strand:+ start:119046 stop:121055 length:2010 start_codon:yes stop_codon:yes gene_type:complete